MEKLEKSLMLKEKKELIGKIAKQLLQEPMIFLFPDMPHTIQLDLDYGNPFHSMNSILVILIVETISKQYKLSKELSILLVFYILMILQIKENNSD